MTTKYITSARETVMERNVGIFSGDLWIGAARLDGRSGKEPGRKVAAILGEVGPCIRRSPKTGLA